MTLNEDSYDEVNKLLREIADESGMEPDTESRVVYIGSGEDFCRDTFHKHNNVAWERNRG